MPSPDPIKNKLFLCKGYPFTTYEHVYFNDKINNVKSKDNLKQNIFKFCMDYHPADSVNTPSTFITSRINLSSGSVRVPLPYHQGIDYNYMIISSDAATRQYNSDLEYYYCFIDSLEFSTNGNTCVIHFHIDVWNTFINKIDFEQSYIEREHVDNDTFGYHTLDEGLAPSEFKIISATRKNISNMIPLIAVGSTSHIFRSAPASYSDREQEHALFPSDNYGYNPLLLGGSDNTSMQAIADIVAALTEADSADSIIGIYLLPSDLVVAVRDTYIVKDLSPEAAGYMDNWIKCKAYRAILRSADSVTVGKPSNPYGLNIKNNKTYTYPFCFCNVSNQLGNELTLKFENSIGSSSICLKYQEDPNINGSVYMYAYSYNGLSAENLDYSISSLNYPTVPFIIDSYDAYIAANRNTLANSKNNIENDYNFQKSQLDAQYAVARATQSANDLYSGVRNIIGSGGDSFKATAGNVASNIIGAGISHELAMYNINASEQLANAQNDYTAEKSRNHIKASLADMANKPDKYCGRYVPNLLMCKDNPGFIIKTMAARKEELQAIDNYFSRYGYKVDTFDTPKLFNRTLFDYKKIIDINITGQAPDMALNALKGIFTNGVTIWHCNKASRKLFKFSETNTIIP